MAPEVLLDITVVVNYHPWAEVNQVCSFGKEKRQNGGNSGNTQK